MRIGVNCVPLKANIGGIRQYFFSLFSELLEYDTQNEYIFFYRSDNLPELAQIQSKRWMDNAHEINSQNDIESHLNGIDLYFAPFGVIWPRPLPVPTVVTLPDNQEVFHPNFFTDKQRYNREWHSRGSARMATRVITISEFSRDTISRHYRISIGKIGVAHLCPDSRYHNAAAIARKPDIRLPEGDFIFYPANRWQHKNHDVLLRALELLARRGLDLSVVFTGHDFPSGYPIERKAKEYGVEDRVISAGYLRVEELAYIYCRAKALVFPSLFEGFGIPLVEAMAAGCPVLAANMGSLPEVGGNAAEYFDPSSPEKLADLICGVIHNEALREKLIERGRERARQFSPRSLADVHIRNFKEAVNSFSRLRFMWDKLVYARLQSWLVWRKYRRALRNEAAQSFQQ